MDGLVLEHIFQFKRQLDVFHEGGGRSKIDNVV